jgi:hypothetical protein
MQAFDQSDSPSSPLPGTPQGGTLRLLLGLLQGVLLYGLYRAVQDHTWPATSPQLFAPCLLAAVFVPLLLISGIGHLDRRQLILWGGGALLLLAALAWYDGWRNADLALASPGGQAGVRVASMTGVERTIFPSFALVFFSAAGLFIGHALTLAAARDRRRIAAYPTYFDTAWKLAVQLAFSVLFTGVTWLVLTLGVALFELVKLTFLRDLIRKEWFSIPVTAFAFACAIHLTDVRPAIVRGIRGLLLVLMSWLLPVSALLIGGFVVSLPFTGLQSLWATRHAASVLLCAAAVLVVLINAAWQQGGDAMMVARVVRGAARVGALLLVPIVGLAAYALLLRVREYGWTAERVEAAACMVVAGCYALGYFMTALRPGWLPQIAQVNIAAAFLVLAVLLALFSPLADPVRIAVASQVARFESGKTDARHFDFAFLRFDGARFGRAALERLDTRAAGADAALVRQKIAAVRQLKNHNEQPGAPALDAGPADLSANLRAHPSGSALPPTLLHSNFIATTDRWRLPECLVDAHKICDAVQLDVTGDGKPEVILLPEGTGYARVLSEVAPGQWRLIGTVNVGKCEPVRAALLGGAARSIDAPLRDIDAGGQHLHVEAIDPPAPKPACKAGS